MSYLLKSFQISFVLHALAVLLLIFMGDRFISSKKILVIDFTIEDTVGADNAGNRVAVKTGARERTIPQKDIKIKDAETAPEIVPQAVPPVTITPQALPAVEIQMPVSAYSETISPSAKGEQDSTGKGITDASSDPFAAGDLKEKRGGGPAIIDDAGSIKYLRANFSYIKDLINRHISYPKTARQMGSQGKVKISFFITSNGHAKGIKIVESSGVDSLDMNAFEAVKSASPFPKPPVEAQLIIPIFYQLH